MGAIFSLVTRATPGIQVFARIAGFAEQKGTLPWCAHRSLRHICMHGRLIDKEIPLLREHCSTCSTSARKHAHQVCWLVSGLLCPGGLEVVVLTKTCCTSKRTSNTPRCSLQLCRTRRHFRSNQLVRSPFFLPHGLGATHASSVLPSPSFLSERLQTTWVGSTTRKISEITLLPRLVPAP